MLKKIINFIKYSNIFTIFALVAFVAITSAVASNEDVIKKVLGGEIIETQGVDNTLLLATDLDNFDLEMKITNVTEDIELVENVELTEDPEDVEDVEDSESFEDSESNQTGNYYVDYEYKTLGIQDNVWQEILRQKQMVISKVSLEGRDLGLHIMEELGEVIDYQLAYLKEVQENEEEKGETLVVETTIYTGLIGWVLDTKTKELPSDYELVVKPPVVEEITPDPFDEGEGEYSLEGSAYYEFLINSCLDNGGYWYGSVCNTEPEIIDPVCNTDNLDLCITQELCEGINLYWYDNNDDGNEVCNLEDETESDDTSAPQPSGTMEPTVPVDPPVCDADNLDLCIDQELCEEAGLYWYDNNDDGSYVCNLEEETTEEDPTVVGTPDGTPDESQETPTVCDADNLDLCDTQDLCDGINLYWYSDNDGNDVCNAFICDADHPTLCDAQEICGDMGLYWYGGECHLEEEVVED